MNVLKSIITRISTIIITAVIAITELHAINSDPAIDENPYYILMGEAEKAISENNYEEAAARLIDAMAVEPENPGNLLLMSNLGIVYSCLDRDSLALATLDEVNRRAPNMTVALVNRGKIKLKCNMTEGAYDDFSKVITLDSLNTDARYFRGMMALYGGNRETAENDLKILESLEADSFRTWTALSALYSLTGKNREAARYFEKLIEKEPSAEYYAGLAGCYLAMEELTDASRVINEGLKVYNKDPELYYYRAWLNRDRFRLDDAKADARKAIEFGASPDKVLKLFKH